MKHKLTLSSLLLLALFMALSPPTLAATTWYVNGGSGSDSNNCKSSQTACKTIGHAISVAHSGDSIVVAAATYVENLVIGKSLQIDGASAITTIIDGGGVGRVITISNASAHVALSNVTISNGKARYGGGIGNAGVLTINNSTVSGNSVFYYGLNSFGGGIGNAGVLTINNSTISGNGAGASCEYRTRRIGSFGGGIYNSGKLTVNNSTISGNTVKVFCPTRRSYCGAGGGGVANAGTLAINNGTVGGNIARCLGGMYCFAGAGGVSGATLQNSIVANNTGGNCGGGVTSNGYNMSSDGTCNFSNSGDRNYTDPRLGPLPNNGGPTQTMALPSGSPAIDAAGNPSGCTDGQGHLLKTDQRGMPRPDKEDSRGCDMGAYERQTD